MELKLTPSKEDYLKVIHLLNDQSMGVRVKDIAQRMEITMASVSCALKSLKKQGFNFVGSTICYAFMQAVGMVNDHTTDCLRYEQVLTLP